MSDPDADAVEIVRLREQLAQAVEDEQDAAGRAAAAMSGLDGADYGDLVP